MYSIGGKGIVYARSLQIMHCTALTSSIINTLGVVVMLSLSYFVMLHYEHMLIIHLLVVCAPYPHAHGENKESTPTPSFFPGALHPLTGPVLYIKYYRTPSSPPPPLKYLLYIRPPPLVAINTLPTIYRKTLDKFKKIN